MLSDKEKIKYILNNTKYEEEYLYSLLSFNKNMFNDLYEQTQKLVERKNKIKNKYKKEKSDKYIDKVLFFQDTLDKKIKKMKMNIDRDNVKQGDKEAQFLIFLNGLISSHLKNKKNKNGNKDKFILPTYNFIADVLECTEDWVATLVKKHSSTLNLNKINKDKISKTQANMLAKFKNFVWVIYMEFNFVFKETDIYFFRTTRWKTETRKPNAKSNFYKLQPDNEWLEVNYS